MVHGMFGKWKSINTREMKKVITLLVLIGFAAPALAQRTSGGSTQSWRRFDVRYDTTYREITEQISMPPTSKTYFRVGVVRGRGLIAEDSRVYYPEDGRKGINGGDMTGGYEIVFGSWSNLTETNQSLHHAVDLSFITEFGWQQFRYEANSEVADYTVDYGSTNNFFYGLGLGATIKPLLFSASDLSKVPEKTLLIDIGAYASASIFLTGETTYTSGNFEGYYNHEDDIIGARLDGTIHLGLRYGFFGVYAQYGMDLASLYNPEYYHASTTNSFSETFEEDVVYNTMSFGVSLIF